ncbi:MAG: hypothetical protein FE834_04565 [Gammaproteobacteria bacterium]|nr:hypothetical protein [Gammaproteobacteria bacterium]
MTILQIKIIRLYRYLLSTHRWSLMYKGINDNKFVDIKQPKSLSRADSFVIEFSGKIYIFFEEWVNGEKAHLSVGELNTDTNELINIHKILNKEYHLSYPFVFKHKDEWYLIPETHKNNSIDLYKFSLFPHKTEKVKTLVSDIDAADTTLTIKDGVVYLFTNMRGDTGYHNSNLSLFYSDDLLSSDFKEHPINPIETDSRYARMAGGILQENEALYRIAQDCSINYGGCMHKFEIVELTKRTYREKIMETLHPPKKCIATHTFSKSDKFIVIDVIYKTRSVVQILKNMYNLLTRIF